MTKIKYMKPEKCAEELAYRISFFRENLEFLKRDLIKAKLEVDRSEGLIAGHEISLGILTGRNTSTFKNKRR